MNTASKEAEDLDLLEATELDLKRETNTAPTPAQAEAGNYKKAKVRWNGLRISIENPKGSIRRGVDKDGNAWSNRIYSHYGYVLGSQARDGDQVDVFIGSDPTKDTVYVIDQVDPSTGEYDEPKCMLGFLNENDARTGYLENYGRNWQGLGDITPMTVEEFKAWVMSDAAKKPAVQAFDERTEEKLAAVPEKEKEKEEDSSPAAPLSPLPTLQKAKEKSDAGDYRTKAALLNGLMRANPDQFVIDSTGRGHPGITHVPTGFRFHLPVTAIPGGVKRAQEENTVTVRPNETLGAIARRFGTNVPSIMAVNPDIQDADRIRSGQVIRLPTPERLTEVQEQRRAQQQQAERQQREQAKQQQEAAEAAAEAAPARYKVTQGDTLSHIAARYPVSLSDIVAANPGVDPRKLQIGQELVIPSVPGQIPQQPAPPAPARQPTIPAQQLMEQRRAQFMPAVEAEFRARNIPPALAHMAQVESTWRPDAVGRAGEIGLFQLKPQYLDDMMGGPGHGITADQLYDPVINARVAASYLDRLQRRHGGQWDRTLGAYQMGPTAYNRHVNQGGDPITPYAARQMEAIRAAAGVKWDADNPLTVPPPVTPPAAPPANAPREILIQKPSVPGSSDARP